MDASAKNSTPCRVVVWARDRGLGERILDSLRRAPGTHFAFSAERLEEPWDAAEFAGRGAEVVLLALAPGEDLERLRAVRLAVPGLPVVVVLPEDGTSQGLADQGLAALEAGAGDVLPESRLESPGLVLSIQAALQAGTRERELRGARDQAEEAARTKSEFVASVSHELRTPIHAILSSTELLMETGLDDEQREYAGTVRSSAAILLGLVNDVLDISRIEAGRLPLETIDFDLCAVVEEAVQLSALEAQRKGLELAVRLPAYLPETLRGDPARLRQVLVNLVNNAVKFTQEGEIIVSVERLQGDRSGELEFSVADTGIGIPPERSAELFRSFSQLDSATNRMYGGTGLGLAISRRLVEMMGGRIGVRSNHGKGSRFWFTIPSPAPRPGESASLLPPDFFSGLRVLVVDDNRFVRQILREQLSSWGCVVEEAPAGPPALDLLRSAAGGPGAGGSAPGAAAWQLVLVDLRMPGMDGWQLAREIRSDPSLGATRLILLSTLGLSAEDAKMKLLRWFNGYVTKPVRRQRLVEAVFTATSEELGLAALPARESPQERFPGGDWRILVVDDGEVSRELFRTVLEKAGYTVDTAADGAEAVQKLSTAGWDLVFMDVNMPGTSGLDVTRRIRERGISTAVVAVTASARADERDRCLASGMNDFLPKPFLRSDLARILGKWLPAGQAQKAPAGSPAPSQAREPAAEGETRGAEPGAARASEEGTNEAFDRPAAVATFLGREDLVDRLVRGLIKRAETGLAAIRAAAARQDTETVRSEAHAIKGAAMNLSARRLAETSRSLERCAMDGRVDELAAAVTSLEAALAELKALVPAPSSAD